MKLYKIKKGNRRSGIINVIRNLGIFFKKDHISYKVKFTKSCIYDLPNIALYGVSKLFGLTFGLLGVHKSSARFGWKPMFNNSVMLYAYCYIKGIRKEIPFAEININELVGLSINIEKDKYIFKVNFIDRGMSSFIEVKHEPISNFSYKNFLYFGGEKISPQDVEIWIE